jgi:hypothetical protein
MILKTVRRKSMKKYHRVFFHITPKLKENLGKFITYYARDVVAEIVNMSLDEIKKVPIEVVDRYYRDTVDEVAVYVSKEIYDKWRNIPWHLKKQAQYLINQKLLQITKREENHGARRTSPI